MDIVVNEGDIDGIILQITQGYCDNLFYIDPDTCFASGFTLFAMGNAGKKYVTEILAKGKVNTETNMLTEPVDLGTVFTLGEYKAIQVLRDQVRDQMYFDKNGQPIKEKIDSLLKDIDLGLWDPYLMWNYENYQSVKAQAQLGQMICNPMQMVQSVGGRRRGSEWNEILGSWFMVKKTKLWVNNITEAFWPHSSERTSSVASSVNGKLTW